MHTSMCKLMKLAIEGKKMKRNVSQTKMSVPAYSIL